MYKWFLAWRYLHTKLIALFGVAAVMLCVAMVLVVLSVMGGFLDTIRDRSRGLHSEIVLEGQTLQGFAYYDDFTTYMLKTLPDVVRLATPSIYTYGIFRVPSTSYTKPARVLGVDLENYVKVNDFEKGLCYEGYYPGTTTLKPQRMPVAGYDKQGRFILPPDLEAASKRWMAHETDAEKIARYKELPFQRAVYPDVLAVIPGPRVFATQLGDPAYAGPDLPGIIVGCDILNPRKEDGTFERVLARGAPIALTLMPLTPAGNPTGEPPVRVPLRYADDSRTGIYEIDSMTVYVDFAMLQHKLAMDPQPLIDGGVSKARTNQLLVGLKPGVDLNKARDRIEETWYAFLKSIRPNLSDQDAVNLSNVGVYTWEGLQAQFIAAVEKEKVLVTFLFSLISLVAIVLLGCIFYMIVEKKTRDIGILKAIGASGSGVATMFITYAAAVGIVGSLLGVLLGSTFVWNINTIQDWLAWLSPQLRVWSPDIYSFDRIPEVVKTLDAVVIAVVAVVSSMIGSLIPAVIAGRVWPVKALRYE